MNSVRDADITNKRVLVRADLDVPIKGVGSKKPPEITDDFRLRMIIPTLEYLVKQKSKIIICGHLDRPGGEVVEELRLDPLAEFLENRFSVVRKVNQILGPQIGEEIKLLEGGDMLMLENLRFDPGERKEDENFIKGLAELADIYVNECFATSHRSHASITGLPKILPSFAGFRLEKEAKELSNVLKNPVRPLVFLLGGAKVATKIPLVYNFSGIADKILLGGKLMLEEQFRELPNVIFPSDSNEDFDIGPRAIDTYKRYLISAGTVVWNGPLGKFETEPYDQGTKELAHFLAKIDAKTIVGGGDTLAALNKFGLRDKMGFISTGGGAMLSFLAEGDLPGFQGLR